MTLGLSSQAYADYIDILELTETLVRGCARAVAASQKVPPGPPPPFSSQRAGWRRMNPRIQFQCPGCRALAQPDDGASLPASF